VGTLHNELRRAGQFQRGFLLALGITDSDSGVERLGETLTPIIDLWSRPEWHFVRDERITGFTLVSIAVAAEFTGQAIVNPAGSNRLVVVELAAYRAELAFDVALQVVTEAQATVTYTVANSLRPLDTRWPGVSGVITLRDGSDAAATLGGTNIDFTFPPSTLGRQFVNLPVVLSPGFGLAMIGQTVNTAFRGIWRIRDRLALPGELG
jgi:hypothetical protein